MKLLGRVKLLQERIMGYGSIIYFIMVFYLFLLTNPLSIPWYIWTTLGILSIPLIGFIDWKYVYPQAKDIDYDKTKDLKDTIESMVVQLKDIKKEIGDLKNERNKGN